MDIRGSAIRGLATRETDKYTEKQTGRTDGRMDGWMDGWIDGRMDGRTGGRTDGWMDGYGTVIWNCTARVLTRQMQWLHRYGTVIWNCVATFLTRQKNNRTGLYVYRYVGLLELNTSSLFTSDNIKVGVVPFSPHKN
jgi:hypothetical protein